MATTTPPEEDERYNTPQLLSDLELNGGQSKSGAGFSDEEKQRLRDVHKTDQMDAAESVRNKEQRRQQLDEF